MNPVLENFRGYLKALLTSITLGKKKISTAPAVNPNLRYQPERRPLSATDLFSRLQSKDHRRALGQAITLLESAQPADRELADELIDLAEKTPPASSTFRLGISGTPGVGKSTFIESYGLEVAEQGYKLAVLALSLIHI